MVYLHRLDGEEIALNAMQVEYVHATPDTMAVLTNGHVLVVREPLEVAVREIEEALRRVFARSAYRVDG